MVLRLIARIILPIVISLSLVTPAYALSARAHQGKELATRAAERLEEAREHFREAKEEFKSHRGLLRDATPAAKAEVLQKAKQFILRALDRAIARIQKIIERVDNSPVITEERKAQLKSELQAQIDALTAMKAQIEAAQNGEQLRSAINDTRGKFTSVREAVKKVVAAILASHLDKVIGKLASASAKLDGQIDELAAQGVNVSRFESQLTEATRLLDQARSQNNVQEYRAARRSVEQARAILVRLHGQIQAAKAKLKKEATPSATGNGE